jgi:putative transposase
LTILDLSLDLDLPLQQFVRYYNTQRTHLGIGKDSPEPREVQANGKIEKMPVVGGLHHYYFRRAA